MGNIIPFQKELCFDSKVSEITSISLEREYQVDEEEIKGNLIISGEYKSHEISANTIPFSFKIPFTIAIGKSLDRDSIKLEINDFAYEMEDNNKIKVSIELELFADEKKEEDSKDLIKEEDEEIYSMLDDSSLREEKEEEKMIMEQVQDENEYVTYHVHIVLEDDSIESICQKYQITEDLLREYNTFTSLNIKDKLLIPMNHE